jgi:RND family efflux transporter MFP subunit
MNRAKLIVVVLALLLLGLLAYRLQQLREPTPPAIERPPVRVETLMVEAGLFSSWAFTEGTAEALRKAFLNFEEAGKVMFISSLADQSPIREGVRVFGPSQGVRLGQLLARLDNRENTAAVQALEARLQSARQRGEEAQAQVNIARNNRNKAQQDFERTEKLHRRGLIASNELERERTNMLNAGDAVTGAKSALKAAISQEKSIAAELNKASVSLEKASLFAPFDGVITSMNLVENNYYYPPSGSNTRKAREAGSAIVLVDDSHFEVRLEVPEYHARNIKEGQRVYLAQDDQRLYRAAEANFQDDDVVEGKVWSVSPSLSLQRRSQLVKVRTQGSAGSLRDGMFVRAWIASYEKASALALPMDALSFSQGNPYVFVVGAHQQVDRRWLKLGLRGLRNVEVLDGLSIGDHVVVKGQHLLTQDTPVEVVGERQ